jgi:hypothetical protein
LAPDEVVARGEFTDPVRSLEDLATLPRIRASLVGRVRSRVAGGTWEAASEWHWLVMPELAALARSRPSYGVGFFGHARQNVDHSAILSLEHTSLTELPRFPACSPSTTSAS